MAHYLDTVILKMLPPGFTISYATVNGVEKAILKDDQDAVQATGKGISDSVALEHLAKVMSIDTHIPHLAQDEIDEATFDVVTQVYNDTTSQVEYHNGVGGINSVSIAIFKDKKSSGSYGGSCIAGTQTRVLNTVASDLQSTVALNTGTYEMTPVAGTYIVRGRAPAYRCDEHKLALNDGTSDVIIGESAYGAAGNLDQTLSQFCDVVVADGIKKYTLKHWTKTVSATYGLGVACSKGDDEYYAYCEWFKIG